MANPYDSDSDEELGDLEETNVLLGYPSKDPGDQETVSRLGGRPEWLDEAKPPPSDLGRCKICKEMMVLLLQLNGELPDRFPGHERRLYVFACKKPSCRRKDGSLRAVRGVRIAPGSKSRVAKEDKKPAKETQKEEAKPATNLGETLFGASTLGASSKSANPFATSSGGDFPALQSSNPFSQGNPFAPASKAAPKPEATEPTPSTAEEVKSLPKTFAETLNLNKEPATSEPEPPSTPSEPWSADLPQPAPYPVSYLADADYEFYEPAPSKQPVATTQFMTGKEGDDDRDIRDPKGGTDDSSMDATFQAFADRLGQNPEQAIRYEYAGHPLLYSKTDAVGRLFESKDKSKAPKGPPACGACGSQRAFEVQLTPFAITTLEEEEEGTDGMEWGTLIVAVCGSDCQQKGVADGEAGYLTEWIGAQWEGGGAGR